MTMRAAANTRQFEKPRKESPMKEDDLLLMRVLNSLNYRCSKCKVHYGNHTHEQYLELDQMMLECMNAFAYVYGAGNNTLLTPHTITCHFQPQCGKLGNYYSGLRYKIDENHGELLYIFGKDRARVNIVAHLIAHNASKLLGLKLQTVEKDYVLPNQDWHPERDILYIRQVRRMRDGRFEDNDGEATAA